MAMRRMGGWVLQCWCEPHRGCGAREAVRRGSQQRQLAQGQAVLRSRQGKLVALHRSAVLLRGRHVLPGAQSMHSTQVQHAPVVRLVRQPSVPQSVKGTRVLRQMIKGPDDKGPEMTNHGEAIGCHFHALLKLMAC